MVPKSFTIIAHRGASGTEPENTLCAFRRAVKLGCRWIECDVRMTRDGVPVVIHDATVNRTTNGHGRVSQMTNDELQRLNAGKGEKIPTLKEALQFAKKRKVNFVLEIKDPKALSKTISLLKTFKLLDHIILSSFSPSVIRHAKQLCATVYTALLAEDRGMDAEAYTRNAQRARADMIHLPPGRYLNRAGLHTLSRAGLTVWAWTVNTKKEARRLKRFGITGIFTDYPDKISLSNAL